MQNVEFEQLVENEYAQNSVRVKARQLCRRSDFPGSEVEDVEQEFWLYLCTHIEKFDPKRSSLNTFIDRMINTAAALLVRGREREKRAPGFATQSLDDCISEKFPTSTLHDSLTANDDRRKSDSTNPFVAVENQEAIAVAMEKLSPEAREVCVKLMDGETPTAIARDLAVSRRRVRNLMQEAQEQLVAAGFSLE